MQVSGWGREEYICNSIAGILHDQIGGFGNLLVKYLEVRIVFPRCPVDSLLIFRQFCCATPLCIEEVAMKRVSDIAAGSLTDPQATRSALQQAKAWGRCSPNEVAGGPCKGCLQT